MSQLKELEAVNIIKLCKPLVEQVRLSRHYFATSDKEDNFLRQLVTLLEGEWQPEELINWEVKADLRPHDILLLFDLISIRNFKTHSKLVEWYNKAINNTIA